MHVLQVTPTYYPELKFGGPPQKIHSLSCELVKRGLQVTVVTFNSESPRAPSRKTVDGVEVDYLSWTGRGAWQLPLDLRKLYNAVRQVDVVHCYGLYNLIVPAAAIFAKLIRRPYVLEPLGMYRVRTGNVRAKNIYHRLFTSRLARHATRVVATSASECADLTDLVPDQARLMVRRNGIDVRRFSELPSYTAFRARHGIAADERVMLYIGRISPIKNLEQLVIAFSMAKLERTRLLLVGPMNEPNYAARLNALVAKCDLQSRASLLGPLYGEEKLAALAAADLFVLPSLSESYGNAAAEAVAAGLPVLLTEGCGVAPTIHQRAGLMVRPEAEALATGMRELLDGVGERRRWTERRSEVIRELSWDEPVRQTEELYRQVTDYAPAVV